jgi:hypothetical protein
MCRTNESQSKHSQAWIILLEQRKTNHVFER